MSENITSVGTAWWVNEWYQKQDVKCLETPCSKCPDYHNCLQDFVEKK